MSRRHGRDPDPGHGCADPARCTKPHCARPVDVHLVRPDRARAVVRELPGWPQSASALFERLQARITREHLLGIAGGDPFGAHQHFPILVRIWMSGRVPARLGFDPGEALRLYRWARGTAVDHLSRAWCCTLLCLCPGEDATADGPAGFAAPLVESCLALGGELPAAAEQLLAWRAVSEPPGAADPGCCDPVALLGLLLLRAAADPADARLPDLVATVADAFARPDLLPDPLGEEVADVMTGGHATTWQRLVSTVLTPRRSVRPEVDRLVTAVLG